MTYFNSKAIKLSNQITGRLTFVMNERVLLDQEFDFFKNSPDRPSSLAGKKLLNQVSFVKLKSGILDQGFMTLIPGKQAY